MTKQGIFEGLKETFKGKQKLMAINKETLTIGYNLF